MKAKEPTVAELQQQIEMLKRNPEVAAAMATQVTDGTQLPDNILQQMERLRTADTQMDAPDSIAHEAMQVEEPTVTARQLTTEVEKVEMQEGDEHLLEVETREGGAREKRGKKRE